MRERKPRGRRVFGQPMLVLLTTLIVLLTPLTQSFAAPTDPLDLSGPESTDQEVAPDFAAETEPPLDEPGTPVPPEKLEETPSDDDVGGTSGENAPVETFESDTETFNQGVTNTPARNTAAANFEGPRLGCSYANPGSGEHASSLCWIDLAGFTY